MSNEKQAKTFEQDEQKARARRPEKEGPDSTQAETGGEAANPITSLQQTIGNRAVQRLLAQRSGGEGSFELDDETAGRINHERGGGQPLDNATQDRMANATGYDFSQVKVHTGAEADALNLEIGAKAFTTGQDIFFRQGAYDPGSSGGQELLAHEMTHVIQQSSGAVGGSGPMTVNAPGDAYEQEADAVAKSIAGPEASAAPGGVQRQEEDEEDQLQMKAMPEDEEDLLQKKPMDEVDDEEDLLKK